MGLVRLGVLPYATAAETSALLLEADASALVAALRGDKAAALRLAGAFDIRSAVAG